MNAHKAEYKKRHDEVEYCDWCGSITPQFALQLMKTPKVRFSGADWKYGWPHKFYFDWPNPRASELVEVGGEYCSTINAETPGAKQLPDGRWYKPIMGYNETQHAKFYNEHLSELSDEELKEFGELSKKLFGIEWGKDERGIFYRAPKTDSFYGYQLWGVVGEDGQPDHSPMRTSK